MATPTDPLPANVHDALQRGQTIEAIKLLRESTGLGLKDAKDIVDAHRRGRQARFTSSDSENSIPPALAEALRQGDKGEVIRLLFEQIGLSLKKRKDGAQAAPSQAAAQLGELSPGEVPRTGGLGWRLAAIAVAGITAYFILGDG